MLHLLGFSRTTFSSEPRVYGPVALGAQVVPTGELDLTDLDAEPPAADAVAAESIEGDTREEKEEAIENTIGMQGAVPPSALEATP